MIVDTMENVVKHTILYSFVISQPFIFNGEITAATQKSFDQHKDHLAISNHSKSKRLLQQKLATLPTIHRIGNSIVLDHNVSTLKGAQKRSDDIQANTDGQSRFSSESLKHELEKMEQLVKEIYPGMQDDKVKNIQKILLHLGYYEGEIDGIYGPLTDQALQMAERKHQISLPESLKSDDTSIDIQQEPNDKTENDTEVKATETTTTAKEQQGEEAGEQKADTHQVKSKGFNQNAVTTTARSLIGTPYVWGGTTTNGFDCSGFVQYVFQTQGMTIPRTVHEVYNFSTPVSSPSVGDVVFFETYRAGPSHMGIYLGNNQFIHAGEARGVEVSNLTDTYWENKYLGANRIRQ